MEKTWSLSQTALIKELVLKKLAPVEIIHQYRQRYSDKRGRGSIHGKIYRVKDELGIPRNSTFFKRGGKEKKQWMTKKIQAAGKKLDRDVLYQEMKREFGDDAYARNSFDNMIPQIKRGLGTSDSVRSPARGTTKRLQTSAYLVSVTIGREGKFIGFEGKEEVVEFLRNNINVGDTKVFKAIDTKVKVEVELE